MSFFAFPSAIRKFLARASIVLAVSDFSSLHSQTKSTSDQVQIGSPISPAGANPKFDWLYSNAISNEARSQLLPMYIEEDQLETNLDTIKWLAAQETTFNLAVTLAGVPQSGAAGAVSGSASIKGSNGQPATPAKYKNPSDVLSASDEPGGPILGDARNILNRIQELDEKIAEVQQKYGVTTLGGPPKPVTRELTPQEIAKLLALTPDEYKNLLFVTRDQLARLSCLVAFGQSAPVETFTLDRSDLGRHAHCQHGR